MACEQVLPHRLARWMAAEPDWEQVQAEQLPHVLNFFRYRLGDTADVEDLTARTFEKGWRTRDGYRRDVARFATWLLTIARNVAIEHLRARQPYEPFDVAAAVPALDNTSEQPAVQHFEAQRLAALLATLPPRQRELIAMKYGADMTNRAMARATGLSESNVGTILRRAVEELRVRWRRTEKMSEEAWLHALRSDPSPLFKEQLRARLRAEDELTGDTCREWPQRALIATPIAVSRGRLRGDTSR
jgi:RNA polymerase sigma-70 factor (ECF subfamily)